jgi:hypothetical protein
LGAPRVPPLTGSIMPPSAVQAGDADGGTAAALRCSGKPLHQRGAVLLDLVRLLAEETRNLTQHVDKARLAVARCFRKISTAPDRLAVRRQKHGQRPAAVFAEMMQRRHVDLVDVRPLLAIDFDVDEEIVHDARDIVVFEALVRHHMAPMTGGITDREQDRLVVLFGGRQRLRTPGPPIDRVVLVLQEIRARLLGETVLLGNGR